MEVIQGNKVREKLFSQKSQENFNQIWDEIAWKVNGIVSWIWYESFHWNTLHSSNNNSMIKRDILKAIDTNNEDDFFSLLWENLHLSQEIADTLIRLWKWPIVAKNLEKFEWLNHVEIAYKIIHTGYWWAIAGNLEKFKWLNHSEIVNTLIDIKHLDAVGRNLEKFEGINNDILKDKLSILWMLWVLPENFEWWENGIKATKGFVNYDE